MISKVNMEYILSHDRKLSSIAVIGAVLMMLFPTTNTFHHHMLGRNMHLPTYDDERFNIINNIDSRKSFFLERKSLLMASSIKDLNDRKPVIRNDKNSKTFIKHDITLEEVQALYDGDKISKYYSARPLEVLERVVEIGSPLLAWWIGKSFDNITAIMYSSDENRRRLNMRAEQLKECIVQGKSVTFIKSGQALALRPDLVKSPEYVRELQKLQDEVGTFDNDVAMKIIEQELGTSANNIFDFDPKLPIASASIGQVYKAKLKANGRSVAVKVQRPDALQYAALDMFILRTIAAFVKKRKNLRSDLVGIADEFGMQLYNELNYNQEALNCLRFRELYGSIPGIYGKLININYNHYFRMYFYLYCNK